ncbi:MAG: hypothetical protein QXL91_02855, partial [Candidatus Bathyarchaeia archaeon]
MEAYHRYPRTEHEKWEPSFTIGRTYGSSLIAIRHMLKKLRINIQQEDVEKTLHILLSEYCDSEYEAAYRVGLAV